MRAFDRSVLMCQAPIVAGRLHAVMRAQCVVAPRLILPRAVVEIAEGSRETVGKTVVVSPHKVWGPQTNDLVLQLGKRRINKIILGGMLANICVESHLREFLERGFEVAVVKDATAGPRHPVWGDGYQAAMINYRFEGSAQTDDAR